MGDRTPQPGLFGWLGAVWRLYRSKDTPAFAKWFFGLLALAYVALPWDLLPDIILGPGFIDDVVVVPLLLWAATWFASKPEEKPADRKRKHVVNERDAGTRRNP